MHTFSRHTLCAVRLLLLVAFLRQPTFICAAESHADHPATGTYLCVEIPETVNRLTRSSTLELQRDGVMNYDAFPTAVVIQGGRLRALFATGSGSWQRVDGRNGDSSLAIITLNEMSLARRRSDGGEDQLEIEHPSTAGPFITRWKRTGDASEPPKRSIEWEEQSRKKLTDEAQSNLDELRLMREEVQVVYVAFCRYESKLDELQVIGNVRTLDAKERNEITELLSAEGTWYLRTPDQNLSGSWCACIGPPDFKIVLLGKNMHWWFKVASGDRLVHAMVNEKVLKLPMIRNFAFEKLRALFDRWFPEWEDTTRKNHSVWLRERSPSPSP